jgi:cell wall-associated NlpC family hydrolase
MRAFTMRSGVLAVAGTLTIALLAPSAVSTAYADELAPTPLTEGTTTEQTTPVPAPITTPTPAPKAAATPLVLKRGVKSSAVTKLERRLWFKKPDSYFGVATHKRVKQIQRWADLPATGVVNAKTSKAINKLMAKKKAILAKKKAIAKKKAAALKKSRSVSGRLAKVVAAAKKYDGGRYVRGGSSPSGFDCSGYTKYVVKKALGKSLPHQSGAQRAKVKKISRSSAKPGDLIFFHGGGGSVYHVGVYAGGNKLYHASRPGTKTGIGPIFSSNVTFGRVA